MPAVTARMALTIPICKRDKLTKVADAAPWIKEEEMVT